MPNVCACAEHSPPLLLPGAALQDEPFSPADWERHAGWWRHCPEPRICLRVFRMLSIIEAWSLFVS